jgi:hypothetical protein
MKKLLLILTALSLSVIEPAQGQTKQNEVGFVFSSLNSFGLTFRTGTEKGLWRFTTLYLAGNTYNQNADSIETTNTSNGFGLKIGREWRKVIIGALEFRAGADLSFNFNRITAGFNDKTISNNDVNIVGNEYRPGINLVLGFNYVFHNQFVIGLEAMPYFQYSLTYGKETRVHQGNKTSEEKTTTTQIFYGLSNNAIALSLLYRFGGKK